MRFVDPPSALILAAAMAVALPALPGCGPQLGGYDYNAGEARPVLYRVPRHGHGSQGNQHQQRRKLQADRRRRHRRHCGRRHRQHHRQRLRPHPRRHRGRRAARRRGRRRRGQSRLAADRPADHRALRQRQRRSRSFKGKDPYITPGQRVRIVVGANGTRRVEPEY